MRESKVWGRIARSLLAAGVVAIATNASATGTAGSLDPAFGSGGVVATPTTLAGVPLATAVQADGRIVAVGRESLVGTGLQWVLRRYEASGAIDTSFSGGTIRMFGGSSDQAVDVALDSAGRIVVLGIVAGKSTLVRLLASGAVDTSFGSGGTAQPALPSGFTWGSSARCVAMQSDGRIVIAGSAFQQSKKSSIGGVMVGRLTTTGTLDTSFSGDGWAFRDGAGPGFRFGHPLAIQADGKILIGTEPGWSIVRFLANGSPDTAFSAPGASTDTLMSLCVDAQGRILAAGRRTTSSGMDAVIRRYLSSGQPDTSFGQGSTFVSSLAGDDQAQDLALQADGRIVLALFLYPNATSNGRNGGAPLRILDTGVLDVDYGVGGVGPAVGGADQDEMMQVAVAPDGGALLVGYAANFDGNTPRPPQQWLLAKYLAN